MAFLPKAGQCQSSRQAATITVRIPKVNVGSQAWLEQNGIFDKDHFSLLWGARCWVVETAMLIAQTMVAVKRNDAAVAENEK